MGNLNMNEWTLGKKLLLAVTASVTLAACQPSDNKDTKEPAAKAATEATAAKTEAPASAIKDADKIGYALGAKMATFIKTDIEKYDSLTITKDSVAQGFADTLSDKKQMTDEEIAAQFALFQQQVQAAQQQAMAVQQEKAKADAEKAKTEGEAFLAANGKKEGVTTTKSGLQYSIVTEGKKDGAKPKATDTVKVHYTGTFIDGKKFDSSVDRGQPATFPLNRVIKGWTEGLQLMSVGSKYHFVIPGDLAYGPNGKPGAIPGNSVLEFDVELLAINPDAKAEKVESK